MAVAILKNKTRHISTTFSAISTKFGMVMQFDPLDRPIAKNLKFQKSKMAAAAILEKSKNCYISAEVSPISTQFGTMMRFDLFDRPDG